MCVAWKGQFKCQYRRSIPPFAATDEMVATDAKQMGKELFATLNVDERKIKLESKVEQLQQVALYNGTMYTLFAN